MKNVFRGLARGGSALVVAATAFALFSVLALPSLFPLCSTGGGNALVGDGESRREYALFSADSSAVFSENPALYEIPFVRGESVFFAADSAAEAEGIAAKIFEKYGARLRFTEKNGEFSSYYAYAPCFGFFRGKTIKGERINLQAVTTENGVKIGVSLVCGGY